MSDHDIKVLNTVTKTLLDSREGYDTCCELAGDSHALSVEFAKRRGDRDKLISEFQSASVALGGESQSSGSAAGAVHRAFARFTGIFRDDEEAAISALDDGEEFLAEKIEDRLEDGNLLPQTRELLIRALNSAKSGERFADRLDD